MDAKAIVRRLIENDEDPKDFIGRNPDIYPKGKATHRYGFNLGEGSYHVGVAFNIEASSVQEAVHKANALIKLFFFTSGRMGACPLPASEVDIKGIGRVKVDDFRVYIDDDLQVTEDMIVSTDQITAPDGWREIDGV